MTQAANNLIAKAKWSTRPHIRAAFCEPQSGVDLKAVAAQLRENDIVFLWYDNPDHSQSIYISDSPNIDALKRHGADVPDFKHANSFASRSGSGHGPITV